MSLHYRSAGNPQHPALILLHGFMGSSEDWQVVVAGLQDEFYCVSFDLPGHGQSVERDTYTFENVLLSFLMSLEELQIECFSLLGYSMGGRIALYLANAMRDRVDALVLESANPGIPDEAARAQRLEADRALADRLETESFQGFLSDWYHQPLFASMQNQPGLLETVIDSRLAHNDPFELAKAVRSLSIGQQADLWPVLSEFTFPVLAVAGAADEKYRAICHRIPATRREIVEQAGHNVHLENPAAYTTAVRTFLIESNER